MITVSPTNSYYYFVGDVESCAALRGRSESSSCTGAPAPGAISTSRHAGRKRSTDENSSSGALICQFGILVQGSQLLRQRMQIAQLSRSDCLEALSTTGDIILCIPAE
jgi:hypothetical protein